MMENNFKEEFIKLTENAEVMERANQCKSFDELHVVISEHIPGVSAEELKSIMMSLQDTSKLEEVELDSVAGGAVGGTGLNDIKRPEEVINIMVIDTITVSV